MDSSSTHSVADLVNATYRAVLGRDADKAGLANAAAAIDQGLAYETFLKEMLKSEEFNQKIGALRIPKTELPDLTRLHPRKYTKLNDDSTVFFAEDESDFNLLEDAIHNFHYYDSFGVWSPAIDLDKRLISAVVKGLGAHISLELGCFTGPVLSVLNELGVEGYGVDVSHLAFALAYPPIKNRMIFGDLLSLTFPAPFDVVYGMDILEHLNPLKFRSYLKRIKGLTQPFGYVYINSPMFGTDDVFGEVFEAYLPEWKSSGNSSHWRHLHCDAKGWPLHGHLIWAESAWWEREFKTFGLIRDREIERKIQTLLATFFEQSPARKTFFVLRHNTNRIPSSPILESLEREVAAVYSKYPSQS